MASVRSGDGISPHRRGNHVHNSPAALHIACDRAPSTISDVHRVTRGATDALVAAHAHIVVSRVARLRRRLRDGRVEDHQAARSRRLPADAE